ncbi:unnamed protein product [Mycena citricolor]|uniref:Arrestin-like N-terminal domain-containing protein n=1 Tax=Mycena citricolor TaxID=2018698 RepID=A0AAD2H8J0_9AGAR|nr:unnamed protein product [Mycena citricolor]
MSTAAAPSLSTPPPAYTPSANAPSYSYALRDNERLLAQSPRRNPRPVGTYVKKVARDTVVLSEQDPSAPVPTYGREGNVVGFVEMQDREWLIAVVFQIEGKVTVAEANGTAKEQENVFLEHSIDLWTAQTASAGSSPPSQLAFGYNLPATFMVNDTKRPLPPSYSSLQTCIVYTLSVSFTRGRARKFFPFAPMNTISIRFDYRPRTRAEQPIPPFSPGSFLQDVKVMPEEWRQHTHHITGRPKSDVAPLDLQVYVPMMGVFALDERIPFHMQLAGPAASLREFYCADPRKERLLIEVRVVRLTFVTTSHGRTRQFRSVIARADLVNLPPGDGHSVSDCASLDWSGDLFVRSEEGSGSFDAGIVKVQDFLVVDLIPVAGPKAHFDRIRHSYPIRIATDPYDA